MRLLPGITFVPTNITFSTIQYCSTNCIPHVGTLVEYLDKYISVNAFQSKSIMKMTNIFKNIDFPSIHIYSFIVM
jgi:hypothetical protein